MSQSGKDLVFHRGDYYYYREWGWNRLTKPGVVWPEEVSGNYTMYPLAEQGPCYAALLGSGTLHTNAGPGVNAAAQVLDWNNASIAGLYGVDNSITAPPAHAYRGSSGTIAPAITFGYLAGKHASHEAVTQPDNMSNQNNNKKENKIVEKPTIAGREPIAVNVKEGRTYYWCSCGKTGTEPFCDGAHEGTSFLPLEFTAQTTDKVSLCTCKQTKNPPYCDGNHLNLDKPENEEVPK